LLHTGLLCCEGSHRHALTDVGWWVSTEISVAHMLFQDGRTVKMEALHSVETLVTIYDITQSYN